VGKETQRLKEEEGVEEGVKKKKKKKRRNFASQFILKKSSRQHIFCVSFFSSSFPLSFERHYVT